MFSLAVFSSRDRLMKTLTGLQID